MKKTEKLVRKTCMLLFLAAIVLGLGIYSHAAEEVGFDDIFHEQHSKTSSHQTLGNAQQAATTSLIWYNDGDFSRDIDGANESVEQFIAIFSKSVKPDNAEFVIIVPDNNNDDPYGEGCLGQISGKWDNSTPEEMLPLVPGGELNPEKKGIIFLGTNACGKDDDFKLGLYKSYILELTVDWTRLLNTSETGYNYWDARFNPIRLVVEGLTDQFDQPLGEITATQDITLTEDVRQPTIVYRELMVQGLGEYSDYPTGVMRFAFDEPMQIIDSDGEMSNSAGGFTPVASEEQVSILQVKYIKQQDPDGTSVSGIEVDGGYFGWNCLWPEGLTTESSVDPDYLHQYDVDIFDEFHKIKQSREFGWHWVYPKENLSPGQWLLQLSGAGDDAGNTMIPFEIEITIKGQFLTIDEITYDYVKVSFAEPFIGGTQLLVVLSPLYDPAVDSSANRYVLSDNIDAGTSSFEFYFDEPLETLSDGLWTINGIEFQIGEPSAVAGWEIY